MEHASKVHIHLAVEDGWPPVQAEEVEATSVGDHACRLLSPPAFARGLAVGDVVRVTHYGSPQQPWVESVLESSGHSTVRVIFFRSAGDAPEGDLRVELDRLGVHVYETFFDGLITIDVPASVNYHAVRSVLSEGESRKLWEFEEGAISQTHDEAP